MGDSSSKNVGKGDLDSSASQLATITLIWNNIKRWGRMNHAGVKKYLHCSVKIAFHEEEGPEIVNMDVTSLFLKDHLEAIAIPG